MIIVFRDPDFQVACNDVRLRDRKFGKLRGKKLGRRLDDLKAAASLAAMRNLPGRCHELLYDRHGQLSLDLDHPYRLIFEPAGAESAKRPDGSLDWNKVTSIRILGIEDTHD